MSPLPRRYWRSAALLFAGAGLARIAIQLGSEMTERVEGCLSAIGVSEREARELAVRELSPLPE